MISQNIEKLSELWKLRADAVIKKNPQHKFIVYSNYAEKITFYRIATGINQNTDQWDTVIGELAEILIQEGLFEIAYRYLDLNGWWSEKWNRIRERVFYNNERKYGNEFERPKFRHNVHQLPRIIPKVAQNKQVGIQNRAVKTKPQPEFNQFQNRGFNDAYSQQNPPSANYNIIPTQEKPNLQAAPVKSLPNKKC